MTSHAIERVFVICGLGVALVCSALGMFGVNPDQSPEDTTCVFSDGIPSACVPCLREAKQAASREHAEGREAERMVHDTLRSMPELNVTMKDTLRDYIDLKRRKHYAATVYLAAMELHCDALSRQQRKEQS